MCLVPLPLSAAPWTRSPCVCLSRMRGLISCHQPNVYLAGLPRLSPSVSQLGLAVLTNLAQESAATGSSPASSA